MEVKRDILWRVYLAFIGISLTGIVIFGRAFYIQQVEGDYWRGMSDSLHLKIQEVDAERGTIYSSDGQILSTSIPQFDIYVDFQADGLRLNNGRLFHENLDSLSTALADLFKDRSFSSYKSILEKGYAKKDRYFLLKRKVSYEDYMQIKNFPLVRLGKNNSGFIFETKNIRLNPYQMLAFRTIGLDRQNSQKVGIEQTYDSVLKGTNGKRLVRYIAGGVAVPVEDGYEIEPVNGKNVVSTLDVRIQDITENALMKMMEENQAQHGCAIVMEVKTGAIKAIANLGHRPDGSYWEDFNYAMTPTEPGSTFKLATLLSVLEDKKVNLNTRINLEGGSWKVNGRTVYDSEQHGKYETTVKRAFELSSNVGMAKLAYNYYGSKPSLFVDHLKKLGFGSTTGIDLYGERKPVLYQPGNKNWSATTLPWMAFGYNIAVTPLHIAMLYNAVANNGQMMRPYLLESIQQDGLVLEQKNPQVKLENICSQTTLKQLQESLIGVCKDSGATGFRLFRGTPYLVAGKTGTALVASGSRGYTDRIYQSSFAGYFPADDPQYTCVVVIVNKPRAEKIYGSTVAGPVFKEISDRLYTLYLKKDIPVNFVDTDRRNFSYAGNVSDMENIMGAIGVKYNNKAENTSWAALTRQDLDPALIPLPVSNKAVPELKGLTLKDAVYICENLGLKVAVSGKGRVSGQSIAAGNPLVKGTSIKLDLN